jgi:hypothetical protein
LISQYANIYELPVPDVLYQGSAGVQITVGDLHGNAMKLIFILVKHGIATNLNAADYNRLVTLYKTPVHGSSLDRMFLKSLTKDDLNEFNQILSKIQFNTNCLLRLIGDELADRGNNDYFTLKILEKLHEHKVPIEILLSNHAIEFLEACELQTDFNPPRLSVETHASSMANLQILVDTHLVTREEILAIVKTRYISSLRTISYSLSKDNQDITLYSHAGIGLQTIRSLAKKIKVEYNDGTAIQLAQTIHRINKQFQTHVHSNTVNTLYSREIMQSACAQSDSCNLNHAPFEFIMWNRRYDNLIRPAVYKAYHIHFVHGHDIHDKTIGNIYNLDNILGKIEGLNEGLYTFIPSWKRSLQFRFELYRSEQFVLYYENQMLIFQNFSITADSTGIWIDHTHRMVLDEILILDHLKNKLQCTEYAHTVACLMETLIQTADCGLLKIASLAKDILKHHKNPNQLHQTLSRMVSLVGSDSAEYVATLREYIAGGNTIVARNSIPLLSRVWRFFSATSAVRGELAADKRYVP